MASETVPPENALYALGMSRRTSRKQPRQGAHLAALRKAAGLTQAELADAIGVPQTNVAFWEFSEKPPRSDVLPGLAAALDVTVEVLLKPSAPVPAPKKRGPTGRLLKAFEAAASLPKPQRQLVEQFVSTLVAQRKAG
jgi:transcriptional regulator with XRE-family HTH domain